MRLVYLSPVRWRSFPQRPHKLVEWFHLRHGGDVLWVDPYPTRLPAWRDLRRMSPDWNSGFAEASERAFEWLTVFRPYALPLEPFTGTVGLNRMLLWKVHVAVSNFLSGNGGRVIGIGKPSTLALEVLQRHPDVTSFFDAMDDFPAFYKGVAKRAAERSVDRIASRVSSILISSEALKRRFRSQRSKLLLVRNACDIDALPPVEAVWREGGPSCPGLRRDARRLVRLAAAVRARGDRSVRTHPPDRPGPTSLRRSLSRTTWRCGRRALTERRSMPCGISRWA